MRWSNGLSWLVCTLLAGASDAAAQSPPAASAQGSPQGGAAQTGPEQSSDVPRITTVVTVTAPAAPQRVEPSADVRTLPSSASVLTTTESQGAPYREPGEVLRSLPGMGFVYYGQGGIPSGPTVRGYTDRNFGQDIAGFLDGIPLNLPGFVASHGALDLTVLAVDSIDRVGAHRRKARGHRSHPARPASHHAAGRSGGPMAAVARALCAVRARRHAMTRRRSGAVHEAGARLRRRQGRQQRARRNMACSNDE